MHFALLFGVSVGVVLSLWLVCRHWGWPRLRSRAAWCLNGYQSVAASKKNLPKPSWGGYRRVLLFPTEILLHHPNRWRSGRGEPRSSPRIGCAMLPPFTHTPLALLDRSDRVQRALRHSTRRLSETVKKNRTRPCMRVVCILPASLPPPPASRALRPHP